MMKILSVVLFILSLVGCSTQSYLYSDRNSRSSTYNENSDRDASSDLNNSSQRQFKCSEISDAQAINLFNQGHTYLDRDNDGKPCEWNDKHLESQTNQSGKTGGNCHYVAGYTRKNGTRVKGYTRCR
jgi:Excalibur calcium-binding domain